MFRPRPAIILGAVLGLCALAGAANADRGLHFAGPAPLDGGGVLAYCSFFLVIGWTPPGFLAFNETADTTRLVRLVLVR